MKDIGDQVVLSLRFDFQESLHGLTHTYASSVVKQLIT